MLVLKKFQYPDSGRVAQSDVERAFVYAPVVDQTRLKDNGIEIRSPKLKCSA